MCPLEAFFYKQKMGEVLLTLLMMPVVLFFTLFTEPSTNQTKVINLAVLPPKFVFKKCFSKTIRQCWSFEHELSILLWCPK